MDKGAEKKLWESGIVQLDNFSVSSIILATALLVSG
jgi:hypothetical protein